MDYPFTKCLHPRRLVNPYTHKEIEVGCGICKSCLMNRANKMSHMCSLEEADHKFCLFFTLTYSSEFVPIAVPVIDEIAKCVDFVSTCERLGDEGLVICTDDNPRHCNKGWLSLLSNKVKLPEGISYVSKRDIQLFNKRVRKQLKKYTDERLRYYIVSEYGPKTFRAHYHGMFFFDEERTFKVLPEIICSCWPYGRVDSSLSRGKCSSYVARYVNSNSFIPPFLACGSSKPFALHSTFFAQGFYRRQKKEIYENEPERFVRVGRSVGGKYVEFMPWRSLACTFFPRCRAYDGKSFDELLRSYTILLEVEKAFGESFKNLTLSQISDKIIQYVLSKMNIIQPLLYNSPYTSNVMRSVADYFHSCFKEGDLLKASTDDNEYDRMIHRIYTDLSISRHFVDFVCDHRSTYEYRRKVSMIVNYWREREYANLSDWYQSMAEYSEQYPSYSLDAFYINKPVDPDFEKSPAYKNFVIDVDTKFVKSIKHKKQNDMNLIFIYN